MGGKTLRNFIELNAPRGGKETSSIRIRRTGNSNNFVRIGGPSLFAWIKLSSDKETERHTPSFKKRYKTIMNSTSVVWFKGQSYRLWNNLWGKFWSHGVKILFESFTLGWGSKGLPHVCDACVGLNLVSFAIEIYVSFVILELLCAHLKMGHRLVSRFG